MSTIDEILAAPSAKPSIDEILGVQAAPPQEPGFVPTIKRTGGQMLTSAARTIEDVTGANPVTQGLRDTGQGIIDRNPAGVQSLSDVVDKPWLTVKESVGQLVPQLGAAWAGAKTGAALGGKVAGPRGAAVGGIAGGLAPIFVQEYGGIRDDQIEGGQESIPRALGAATAATALERFGLEKLVTGGMKSLAGKGIKGIAKEAGKNALVEGGTEYAQTGIEQVGAFHDPFTAESQGEAALAGVMGGIGGGVVGGGLGAARTLMAPPQEPGADLDHPQGAPPAPPQQAAPTLPPGDAIRAQKLPETGPLSGAVNAGIEATAQEVEAVRGSAVAQRMADAPGAPTGEILPGDITRRDGSPFKNMEPALLAKERAEKATGLPHELVATPNGLVIRPPAVAEPAPGRIPTGSALELDPEQQAALAVGNPNDWLEQYTAEIPAAEATELPLDVVEGQGIPDEPRAARRRSDAVAIDPAGPNAVAQYIAGQRQKNTMAARAFVRDFDAGRITSDDVLERIVREAGPAPVDATREADARLADAAKAAPEFKTRLAAAKAVREDPALKDGEIIKTAGGYSVRPKADELLTADGFPYGTRAAAQARATREGGGEVVETTGGFVVRKESASAADADRDGVAGPADARRGDGGQQLRQQQPGVVPADAQAAVPPGVERVGTAAVRPGSDPAPDASLSDLEAQWADAARRGDADATRTLNDRIVALKAGASVPAAGTQATTLRDRIAARKAATEAGAAQAPAAPTPDGVPAAPAAVPAAAVPAVEAGGVATGLLDASSPEDVNKTAARDAKIVSDAVSTEAFAEKGYGGLNIPRQRMVKSAVLRLLQDKKILGRVVESIPVDVMNVLVRQEGPPKTGRSNDAMLKNLAAVLSDDSVPFVDVAGPLMRVLAGLPAEQVPAAGNLVGRSRSSSSAMGTDELDGAGRVGSLAGPAAKEQATLDAGDVSSGARGRATALDTLESRQVNSPTRVDELGPSSGATNDGPTTVSKDSVGVKPTLRSSIEAARAAPGSALPPAAAAQPKRPPKSFRKKVKVTTPVYVEETSSFEPREVDADTAIKALDEDIAGLDAFLACLKG